MKLKTNRIIKASSVIPLLLITFLVLYLGGEQVQAGGVNPFSNNINITASTTNWTKSNVRLNIETIGVDRVIMPDGTINTNSNFSYTVTNNGVYSFIALSQSGNVLGIRNYVVENIDRVGKDSKVNPSDGQWKNKDVLIDIQVLESNKK